MHAIPPVTTTGHHNACWGAVSRSPSKTAIATMVLVCEARPYMRRTKQISLQPVASWNHRQQVFFISDAFAENFRMVQQLKVGNKPKLRCQSEVCSCRWIGQTNCRFSSYDKAAPGAYSIKNSQKWVNIVFPYAKFKIPAPIYYIAQNGANPERPSFSTKYSVRELSGNMRYGSIEMYVRIDLHRSIKLNWVHVILTPNFECLKI